MVTSDLVKEMDSLVGLMEETGIPASEENSLIGENLNFVGADFLSAVNDVSVRVNEFKHRGPEMRPTMDEVVRLIEETGRPNAAAERKSESKNTNVYEHHE
ncbi:unnamed protein product [Linum tenue]|uniref:Uncharacterized protein n=1 Tax=Linum tenue TaxID=586396 RepID=A0AAV0H9C6_9ROSI|nr:unnamed protein product [Linum tenue]